MSLRELARRIEISDSHLSRVVRLADYKRASPELMARIAREFKLPVDYFPEYREAYVIDEVTSNAKLRDAVYLVLRAGPRRGLERRIAELVDPS